MDLNASLATKHKRSDFIILSCDCKPRLMAIERARCTMLQRLLPWLRGARLGNCAAVTQRCLSTSSSLWKKKMPDRPPPINEEDFTEVFLKGSGPGGQKIVSSSACISPVYFQAHAVARTKHLPRCN
jgi:hypothetical protein